MAKKGYTDVNKIQNYMLITIEPWFLTQIDDWIETVENYIDRKTGRSFVPPAAASARYFDGNGSREMRFDEASEITEVMIDDVVILPAVYVTKPYNTVPIKSILLDEDVFAVGEKNIKITAKWGQALPKEIEFAATVLMAGIINYARSDEGAGEIQSMTVGRYSVTYATGSKQEGDAMEVENILKGYKRYHF